MRWPPRPGICRLTEERPKGASPSVRAKGAGGPAKGSSSRGSRGASRSRKQPNTISAAPRTSLGWGCCFLAYTRLVRPATGLIPAETHLSGVG
jgi:hypothetical protein